MEDNQNTIKGILNLILTLQKNPCTQDKCEGCTKPFLGPTTECIIFNTRPITLFSCCNGKLWEMPYTLNCENGTSSVFRIENVECDCATFRILAPVVTNDTTEYIATNSYFTIDLSCVLALQCLPDTCVELC